MDLENGLQRTLVPKKLSLPKWLPKTSAHLFEGNPSLYYRLSLLMWLVYAIPGAWIPVLSLRLEEELGFSSIETSLAYSSWAVAAMISSLIAGQVADRWMSIERCLCGCSLIVGILLLVLAELTTPIAVVTVCFLACMFIVPILTLGLTMSLANLDHPEKQFGWIRLWGTLGWISAGILLWCWLHLPKWFPALQETMGTLSLASSMRLGGMVGVLLSIYSLTLPHTPPLRLGRSWLAPLGAISMLRERSFAVFCICGMLMHITIPFNVQQVPLVLRHVGLDKDTIPLASTIAQWSEVLSLGLLPFITGRFSVKQMLLFGISIWTLGLLIMMIGTPTWLVVASLSCNGLFITFWAIRGQVFVNRQAGKDVRASAQGLTTMLNGTGLLAGNLLVGVVRDWTGRQFLPTFAVSVVIASFAIFLFAFGFRPKPIATPAIVPETPPATPWPEPATTPQLEVACASANQ